MSPLLALLPAALPTALAGAPPPVVGGEETAAWRAVGAVVFQQGAASSVLCTGTLVAEDAVLTAAHCADELQLLVDVGLDAAVLFGSRVPEDVVVEAPVEAIFLHPDWDPDTFTDDLALLAVTPVSLVEPLAFSAEAPRPAWTGESLLGVGFGDTDEDGGGAGVKRSLALQVTAVDADFVRADAAGSANLCHGDSGGPLVRQADGVSSLAGVAAFVFHEGGGSGCTGGGAAAVRADRAQAWVEAVRAGEAWQGVWASPVASLPPEPVGRCATGPGGGGAALGLLGLLGLLGRRRRPGPGGG